MVRGRTLRLVTNDHGNEQLPKVDSLTSEGTISRRRQFLSTASFASVALLMVTAGAYLTRRPQTETLTRQSDSIGQTVRTDTAVVTARELFHKIKLAGNLDYGDGQLVHVTSPIAGRITRVGTQTSSGRVVEGEELFRISSDALLHAREELLQALSAVEPSKRNANLLDVMSTDDPLWTARRNLLMLGVPPDQIADMARSRTPNDQLSVESCILGILLVNTVRLGQQVGRGESLCQIAEPDPMWLYFNVPITELPWISLGRAVQVEFPGGTTPIQSKISVISPVIDTASQTVRIGVPIPNPDGKLTQGLRAVAAIHVSTLTDGTPEPTGLEGRFICPVHPTVAYDQPGSCPEDGLLMLSEPARQFLHGRGKALAVPVSAVLDRNGHNEVRRLTPSGAAETREIEVGPIAQSRDERGTESSYYPVKAGLSEGDTVLLRPHRLSNPGNRIAGLSY